MVEGKRRIRVSVGTGETGADSTIEEKVFSSHQSVAADLKKKEKRWRNRFGE